MRRDVTRCALTNRATLCLLVDDGGGGHLGRDELLAPGLVGCEPAVAVFRLVGDCGGRVSDLPLLGREDAVGCNEPSLAIGVVRAPAVRVAVLAEPAGKPELVVVDERRSHLDGGLRQGSGRCPRAKPCVGGRVASRGMRIGGGLLYGQLRHRGLLSVGEMMLRSTGNVASFVPPRPGVACAATAKATAGAARAKATCSRIYVVAGLSNDC